jgi:hypothetical protein
LLKLGEDDFAVMLGDEKRMSGTGVPRHLQVAGDLLDRLTPMKCSRRIRAIVSLTIVPNHLLQSKAGRATAD